MEEQKGGIVASRVGVFSDARTMWMMAQNVNPRHFDSIHREAVSEK